MNIVNSLLNKNIILIAIVAVAVYFIYNKYNKEGYYGDNYFPVSELKNQYAADMPTYSTCPYIPLDKRPPNWPRTMTSFTPHEIEQNEQHKYVYSDNPEYNFY